MSKSVFELLRERYPAPAWAFLEEVRNGTGYGSVTRTADALAMSLYPSRGLHLHGFEVKVERYDWVRELKDPAKAEEIAKYCHFWWLVIGDPKVLQNGELPATWGLLVSDGKKLTVEKEPMFNKEALPPSYKFLGAILRKVCSTSTDQVRLDRARAEGSAEGYKQGQQAAESRTDDGRYKQYFEDQQKLIHDFQEASGLHIDKYSLGRIGAAVRLLAGEWDSPIENLASLSTRAKEIAEKCDAALLEVRKILPAKTEAA